MTIIILLLMSVPVAAQDSTSTQTVEEMRQMLEQQQQQLEEQQQLLLDLRQQVQKSTVGEEMASDASPEKSPAESSEDAKPTSAHREAGERGKAEPEEEWPGSFGVESLNTRFKIGGFAEMNVIYDDGAIASKGQFVTSTIATGDATKAEGADGQTGFSIQPSRLSIETRTPFSERRLKTFLSGDLYGDGLGLSPEPRIRQAYGELTNILFGGDLLAGQVWTAFSDLNASPNTLDFEGPGSSFTARAAELRWTKGLSKGLDVLLAVDSPGGHSIQGADLLTRWPDGVVSLVWDSARVHLMGTGMLRDLRASADDGPTQTVFGWGISGSGSIGIPIQTQKDLLTFSVTYGEGVGSYFNDAPPDAVLYANGTDLEAIPVLGYFVSYEHWWSSHVNSTVVYGALNVDNREAQPDDAFNESQYFSANLIWMPIDRWLIGVEYLRGERTDKDETDGTVNRYMLGTRFDF